MEGVGHKKERLQAKELHSEHACLVEFNFHCYQTIFIWLQFENVLTRHDTLNIHITTRNTHMHIRSNE